MSLSLDAKLRIESLAAGDESRCEARALIARWEQRFPGDCPIQAGLIEQAVTALVDLGRCRRTRAALVAETVRTATLGWEHEQEDRILRCLRTIDAEPYQGMADFQRFAAGVRHLISRWECLEQALAQDKTWYGNMMFEAIQMQGCSARLSELHCSEDAYLTCVYCFFAGDDPQPQDVERLWADDVMPLSIRCKPPQPWPPPREFCQEQLQKLLDCHLPPLRELERKLRLEVEEPERASAIERALARTAVEESRLLRAERHHERSFREASKALLEHARQAPAHPPVDETRLIARPVPAEPPGSGPDPDPDPEPAGPPRTAASQALCCPPPRSPFAPRKDARDGSPAGCPCADRTATEDNPMPVRGANGNTGQPVGEPQLPRMRDGRRVARSCTYVIRPPRRVEECVANLGQETSNHERTPMDEHESKLFDECMQKLPPSPARSQAARINGAKSKGATTLLGQMACRLAGFIHGMTSTLPLLPGESEEDFNALEETINIDYETCNDSGRELASVAANALWMAKRCRDADAAETTLKMSAVVDEHDDRKSRELETLIAMLPTNPPEAVRQLKNSTQGLHWMLGQVEILEARLRKHCTFEPSQRLLAIRLSGYDPKTVLTEPAVTKLNLAYISGLHGHGGTDAAEVASILQADKQEHMSIGEFQRRLGGLIVGLETIDQGHLTLKKLMAELRESLKDRLELVDNREARNLALEFRGARVDIDRPGILRQRYETGHLRLYFAALRELRGLQQSRGKEGPQEGSGRAARAARKAAGAKSSTDPKGSEPVRPEHPAGPVPNQAHGEVGAGAPGVARGSSG